MSIYATLWALRFPATGDDYLGCDWVTILAQSVPSHIGSPTSGCGYEDGDAYAAFLPPAVPDDPEVFRPRAVVFVRSGHAKGTARSGQEYVRPLLTMTGDAYLAAPFHELHRTLCDALRGDQPPVVAQVLIGGQSPTIARNDGTIEPVEPPATLHEPRVPPEDRG